MKRLVASVIMLIVIIFMSFYSVINLGSHKDAILAETRALRSYGEAPDTGELVARSQALFEDWNRREGVLVLYIRHDILDQITQLLAELPALAEFEDWAAFFGRLDVVEALLEDLWQAQMPSYRNLL